MFRVFVKALHNAIRQKTWLASSHNFSSHWAYFLKEWIKKVLIVERPPELPKQIRRRSGHCYLSGVSAIYERSNFVAIFHAIPSELQTILQFKVATAPCSNSIPTIRDLSQLIVISAFLLKVHRADRVNH
jgi:hypothetical protein